MFCSPLRYPGGKGKLATFMKAIIEHTNHLGGIYIEPFAGGAGIAMELLLNKTVSEVVINDLDKGIYSFWRSILTETDRFLTKLESVPVTIDEWYEQRSICNYCAEKYSFELGFATFFMNRTNRSGIIKSGVIGGVEQNGQWKIDVRFNKKNLIKRIEDIAKNRGAIHVYNKDVGSFIVNYMPNYTNNALAYFDPPYYRKGKELYLNFFKYEDHKKIAKTIEKFVNCDWIVTYDDVPEIAEIYRKYRVFKYDLNYSVATKRKASEIMIFSDNCLIPDVEMIRKLKVDIDFR